MDTYSVFRSNIKAEMLSLNKLISEKMSNIEGELLTESDLSAYTRLDIELEKLEIIYKLLDEAMSKCM